LDSAYVSALFGLAGVGIGGLTSFTTSWFTQEAQLRDRHLEAERLKREKLFTDFVAEASRLYADALSHEKDDVSDLVQLYALLAKMRLLTSREPVLAAERVMETIIETYQQPNRTLHELHDLAKQGGMDFLTDFAEACRAELVDPVQRRRGSGRP
jgi:hypothetical protein